MATYTSAVVESASISASRNIGGGFSGIANESAQGSETITTRVVLTTTVQESLIALDTINTIADVTLGISEGIVIVDAVPTNADYNIPLNENILLSDQTSGRFLWELVDDSATTDWILIDAVN